MKAIRWLDKYFEEVLLVTLLVLISCVELLQVICREVPFLPTLKWTEEFSRFCWIWTVFLSLPYTIRNRNMLRVSILMDLLPNTARQICNIVVDLITSAAMLMLGWHSITTVRSVFESGETSPAMVWPMGIIYSVLLLGFFLGFLRGLQQAFLRIRNFDNVHLTTIEHTMADAAEEADAGRRAEGGDR